MALQTTQDRKEAISYVRPLRRTWMGGGGVVRVKEGLGYRRSLVLGRDPTRIIPHIAAFSICKSNLGDGECSAVGNIVPVHVEVIILRAWTERIAKQEPCWRSCVKSAPGAR